MKQQSLRRKLKRLQESRFFKFLSTYKHPLVISIFAFGMAYWIMTATLGYNEQGIRISEHLWSDFMNHIPLIRSFSLGSNIPPESPLFVGEPIRYHFLFYLLVGLFEKLGIRLDIALNFLSILGFASLIIVVFILTKKITKSVFASWVAAILIVLNTSLSWLYYFSPAGLNLKSLQEVVSNSTFAAFGPWDNSIVSAFWTLNVYTNQRHLGLAFVLVFVIVWSVFFAKSRRTLLLGIILIGIMPWFNKAMLLIVFVALAMFFVVDSQKRKRVLIGSILGLVAALPGIIFLTSGNVVGDQGFRFNFGFLYNAITWEQLHVQSDFLRWWIYWFMNLGFLPIAAAAGVLNIHDYKKIKFKGNILKFIDQNIQNIINVKTVWYWIGVVLFLIANTFVFAPDLATNHKFINFVVILWGIYAGYFLHRIWKDKSKLLAIVALVTLVLSGILDFFPVINQKDITWTDIPQDKTAKWLVENTKPESKFLNLTYAVNPIGTAGRRIYFGWDYLSWSIGYDTDLRRQVIQEIATGRKSKSQICKFLYREGLDYIITNETEKNFIEIEVNTKFFEDNFIEESDLKEVTAYNIYNRERSCTDDI